MYINVKLVVILTSNLSTLPNKSKSKKKPLISNVEAKE